MLILELLGIPKDGLGERLNAPAPAVTKIRSGSGGNGGRNTVQASGLTGMFIHASRETALL